MCNMVDTLTAALFVPWCADKLWLSGGEAFRWHIPEDRDRDRDQDREHELRASAALRARIALSHGE